MRFHKKSDGAIYIAREMRQLFSECHIENALGCKPTTAEKNWLNTIPLPSNSFCILSHSVRIYQPLEVASEVVVHRITQVGRIRADY